MVTLSKTIHATIYHAALIHYQISQFVKENLCPPPRSCARPARRVYLSVCFSSPPAPRIRYGANPVAMPRCLNKTAPPVIAAQVGRQNARWTKSAVPQARRSMYGGDKALSATPLPMLKLPVHWKKTPNATASIPNACTAWAIARPNKTTQKNSGPKIADRLCDREF